MSASLDARIFVAGHRGMVGSAIVRRLQSLSYRNVVTADRASLDLINQAKVQAFLANIVSIRCIWLRPKWVVFMPTTLIPPSLFTII